MILVQVVMDAVMTMSKTMTIVIGTSRLRAALVIWIFAAVMIVLPSLMLMIMSCALTLFQLAHYLLQCPWFDLQSPTASLLALPTACGV